MAGYNSGNVFRVAPGGTITEIVDGRGDGIHGLVRPWGLVVEGSGVVYVTGQFSHKVFRIKPEGHALADVAGLVVPGFEVEIGDPEGATTLFAVRNTSDRQVFGRADFFGAASAQPLRTDAFFLEPQETLASNVRVDLSGLEVEDGLATGLIVVNELGGTTAPSL